MLSIECPKSPHNFASNTYVISCKGEYAVIDPSVPFNESLISGKLKYILLTHSHFDHILDIDSWVRAGGEVLISEYEKDFLADPSKNCYGLFYGTSDGYFGEVTPLRDGDVIKLGNEEIRFINTPGHTVGSSIFLCGDVAFVGDTVFAGGGYGRWDLPSGNFTALKDSIDKIKSLPEHTVLYPGHGEPTTVNKYKKDFIR